MVNVQPTAAAPAVVKEVDISVLTPYSPLAGKRKGSDTMYQKAHHDPLMEQGDMEDVQPTAVAQMQHRKWTSTLSRDLSCDARDLPKYTRTFMFLTQNQKTLKSRFC